MEKLFQFILDNYISAPKLVSNIDDVYKVIKHTLPFEIKNFLNDNKLIVSGSMGQGRKSDCPWISIMNADITRTTQSGLYIVFLFKKDMTGFYLTLNQGIKNFNDLFKNKKYEYATKVTNYFKEEIIETSFSKSEIHLGNFKKGERPYGYEQTTILSKYYPSNEFSDLILKNDLIELTKIYSYISKHFTTTSYNDVIKQILASDLPIMVDGDIAINEIKNFVDPNDENPFGFRRKLIEKKPYVDITKSFSSLTKPKIGKIDYIKKAYKDMKAGLLGESLVMDYEKERLIALGREDLASKVDWVGRYADGYGYDILSFDVDENGKEKKMLIEVKSTSSRVDTEFYISRNEVETSVKYKNNYCVYRLYDVYAESPKFYKAYGEVSKNFILDPVTFMARYKFPEKAF